jgi:hypothetical protein
MREDGTFDVDANTSIDQLSEELGIKIPEVLFHIRSLFSVGHKMCICDTGHGWSLKYNFCHQIHCISRM